MYYLYLYIRQFTIRFLKLADVLKNLHVKTATFFNIVLYFQLKHMKMVKTYCIRDLLEYLA